MQCPYCKKEFPEGTDKCPHCGREINVRLSSKSDLLNEYEGPLATSRPALLWGILASAFALSGFFGALGIVFGIIGLRRANQFRDFTGSLYGRAKAGKILSFAGIIGGAITFAATIIVLNVLMIGACISR